MKLPDLALTVKELGMFAKELSWQDIIKIAAFFNLCILPIVLAFKL